jgi:hypothetical protein
MGRSQTTEETTMACRTIEVPVYSAIDFEDRSVEEVIEELIRLVTKHPRLVFRVDYESERNMLYIAERREETEQEEADRLAKERADNERMELIAKRNLGRMKKEFPQLFANGK